MRNLGTRFNESNIITVFGGDDNELSQISSLMLSALDAPSSSRLTPSEERVFNGLLEWYKSIDSERPYKHDTPAYAYINLNTGVNLLFLTGVPYEGCRGGLLDLYAMSFRNLVPDQFD